MTITKVFVIALQCLFFILLCSISSYAVEIEVQGEGIADIDQDLVSVQYKARAEAVKNAIVFAINRVLGPDASKDPKVQQKFNEILSQINIYKIKQTDVPRSEGHKYIVNTTLIIDGTKLRQLISDMGVAVGTTMVRSSSIMTILDEFYTKPSDLSNSTPLKEITVYKYDKDIKYKESEDSFKKKKRFTNSFKK